MQVKTFEATNMKDAVKAVKNEFGSRAVILRTKEKMQENTKIYEVTAAIPDQDRSFNPAQGASAQTNSYALLNQPEIEARMDDFEVKLARITDSLASKTQFQAIENGLEELRLLMLETLRVREGSLLKDVSPIIVDLHRQLQLMNIDETQLSMLVKFLTELPEPAGNDAATKESQAEYYKGQAIRWMLKRFTLSPRWQPTKGAVAIHAFVGPSGSGKTSLLAKVAANYSRQQNIKVLCVSFDHQRLAAAEQLRIYSKILDVPFETIDSAAELPDVLARHRDIELVLIDTAGRSPKNQSRIQDLSSLGQLSLPIEFHLVLSVTEKASQLDRCVRSFAPLSIASLCFTKMDESWSYGEIYNLASKWSLPLSFFSTGQRIPEDVERASKERVIERVFSL